MAQVEFSTDGGATFSTATLEPRHGWSWQRFSLGWQPQKAGEALLRARAIDANGASQPFDGGRNAVHSVRATVR